MIKNLIGKVAYIFGVIVGYIYALRNFIAVITLIAFIVSLWNSSPEVQAGIIGFIGAVLIAAYTHTNSKKREIEARHFTEKRQAYMQYINLLFGLLHENKNGKPSKREQPLNQQQIKQMMEFKKQLLVWGSAEVIQAYYQFEQACDPEVEGYEVTKTLLASEKLFRALRKDLGHDDSILGDVDLVGLILKPESKRELEENLSNG